MLVSTLGEHPCLILGATAAGKSALALELAARWHGEIISLDAIQIYRGMDIGTAKPTPAEQQRVRHHLIDCLPLCEQSDVAQFIARVETVRAEIAGRGVATVLVGGTAMYIRALVDGLFSGPPASADIRAELLALAKEHGPEYLHEHLLRDVDPAAAARIHPRDVRRVVRAIEVFRLTGTPISALQSQWAQPERPCGYRLIGLNLPRAELYRRIEQRVDAMLAAGLLDEVRALREQGIEENQSASQAIGYKEMLAHLRGECTLERAVELLKRNTRRFAKHQLTWFRKDPRIAWFDVTAHADTAALADAVEHHLSGGGAMTSAPPARLPTHT